MNVNFFFTALALLLAGLYFFIRPIDVERGADQEVPQLDLQRFTIYELDREGLKRIMFGEQGQRFGSSRYIVHNIVYSDRRDEVTQDITAREGKYYRDILTLTGSVAIDRSDGVKIRGEKMAYDQARNVIRSYGDFNITQGPNRVTGIDLIYLTEKGHGKAAQIEAIYELNQEGK